MDNIYQVIFRSNFPEEQIPTYISIPIIGKNSIWTPLGKKISKIEKSSPNIIPINKFFTIRLDGKNFSSVIPILKNLKILENGYSITFEKIMKSIGDFCCKILPGILYVFTQSDEIIIIFRNFTDNLSSHPYGGRKDKLLTICSGLVTSVFQKKIYDIIFKLKNPEELSNQLPLIAFDARMGIFDSLPDAFELILWRSYDCSVNGISQAIFLSQLFNREESDKNCTEKLKLLLENNLLPLTDHQSHGTLYKREEDTKKKTKNLKKTFKYLIIDGPVINFIKNGILNFD